MENFTANSFKKKNLKSFEEWLYYRIFTDKKYDPNKIMMYCIKISFGKRLIDAINTREGIDILETLRPSLKKKNKKKKTLLQKIYQKFPFTKKVK
jgi:hypothetical protein